ncbi:metallophosphoesterase [Dysgonomonas sp. Marseille-P4677]|uniref:PA14 domain-containing protein n=1 Tax=Dysgonomonas sp. Marseille-P4677 TaxID=2364790 RepID=UPI001912ABD4|nr:PA14 domain-containing protein [Dysgonomonas sp. Marseille-P4677]MBK5721211.1 metallophosphoesterase [Dysgonomonas sp. Marseille-P4677]
MKKYILIIFSIFLYIGIYAQKGNYQLKFNKNGEFKIAQFTDIHWSNKSPNCPKTVEVIKSVLQAEKPDIAILTGDIVTDAPAKEGWLAIAKIFADTKTPWAVTLGNHDAETGVSRKEIFDIIESLPYFIGEKGPEMTGCGNYVLPIQSSQNTKTAAALYCIDTNNKPPANKYGHYDWIHFDQIEWYRKTSDKLTAQNNNTPLPALAFFHIPVLEFNNVVGKETTIGNKEEGVASPEINSGMFCSMVEKKDVMGIFVGHDHDNDYIGIEQGIALAFGRTSGIDAYGDLERGSRIIMMYEGKNKFDTWIRTPKGTELMYYYPSGLSSIDEGAMEYLPAKNIKVKQQGVSYSYYEGTRFKSTDQIKSTKPIKTGILNNISIASAAAQDSMAFTFKTWIKIPERGVYRFYTYSDDGSTLFIDGKLVVDNDGSHSMRRRDGKIALEAGFHELEVLYFEDYMGEILEVGYSSRNIREDILPDNILFIAE